MCEVKDDYTNIYINSFSTVFRVVVIVPGVNVEFTTYLAIPFEWYVKFSLKMFQDKTMDWMRT